MLSITGMTLEQFADLMQGLGYAAEKGERAKVKAAPEAAPAEEAAAETPAEATDAPAAEEAPAETEAAPEAAAAEAPAEAGPAEEAAEPEVEVFYTFTWAGRQGGNRIQQRRGGGQGQRRNDRQGDKPRGKGGKPKGKGGPRRDNGPKQFQARPPKKEKAIDPDNPFAAALMGLKGKD